MVRSKKSKPSNKARNKFLKGQDCNPTSYRIHIPAVIPEKVCEHCLHQESELALENFDDHGYVIPKTIAQAGTAPQESGTSLDNPAIYQVENSFRFLDLPPEVRDIIYKMVVYQGPQPICVPDHLLRPSKDFSNAREVLQQCSPSLLCFPCQLHQFLGTSHIGLSRSSQLLHSEMAVAPYEVTTFSLHNLYYLQIFLRLIGSNGRRKLKSLRFGWSLPEEEAVALNMYTSVEETYTLLRECKALDSLHVNIDVDNLLRWKGSGRTRPQRLDDLNSAPNIALICGLRDLRDIRVAWKHYPGLHGMEEWAKTLVKFWKSSAGTEDVSRVKLNVEVKQEESSAWRYIHWTAQQQSADDLMVAEMQANDEEDGPG